MANIISRLKLESGEFDSKIKRAGQELLAYSEHCKKMGLQMGYANRDAKEFAKQLGSMATVSTTARGKINELSEAFVNAKVMYKNMTDEEKKGEFGRNLAASLDQLKTRLNDAKKDLADVTKELNGGGGKFGEFGNVLDTLGSKLGVTGNLTEMLTSKTALLTGAVGAGIAVVTKSAEAWASYNAELAKQDQVTQVTTGLKGEDADRMTDKMRALSDTYKVDFREAVNAANTLMTQFGKTGDEATQLIKDGLRGMIRGDGPKLLSMIQQYAPAFRDAGISASQLIAIIHNSEGGIFTDQNMNAIVMGIKNIRLMTEATSQSLAKMGIDGKKMSEQLNNGTLTVFDALKQVAAQLQTVDSNSKTAGEVMQQVFGRQGVTAGTNLAKAIETLNTDLEKTKVQTGEVGDSLADLQEANEKLNTAIRDCFEYDGWEQMANGIKSKLITALAAVIDKIADIKRELGGGLDTPKSSTIGDRKNGGGTLIDDAIKMLGGGNTQRQQRTFTNQLNEYNRYIGNLRKQQKSLIDEANSDISGTTYQMNERTIRNIGNMITAAEKNRDEYMRRANDLFNNGLGKTFNGREWVGDGVPKKPQKTNPVEPIEPTKTTTTTPKPEDTNYAADSIMAQEKLVAKLTDQYKRAGAAVKDGIKKQLDEAKKTLDEMQGKGVKVELPKGSMAALNKELQDYQKAQQLATSGREWREYQAKIDDVTRRIAIMKGELPKGQQATFTVSVDSSNAEELKKTLEDMGDKDIKVTTSYDDTNLQDIPGDQERTVTFTADDSDVLAKVADIKGITIDPKTLTFKADDEEVIKAAAGINGVTIDEKTLTVIPQTLDAVKALAKLNGFALADKQVAVIVNDGKAMKDLQAVAKVTIPDKDVNVKVTNPKAVDVKVNEVVGTQHHAPTLKPIEQTVNYKQGDVDLQDIPDEKTVRVDYEQGDMPDMPDDEQRTVTFTAEDRDVLSKVADIKGITIDPKTLEFRADNAEAMKAVEGMKNVTFDKKTMTVVPQTQEAAKELLKLNTFKLADKQVAVTVNDEKAMKDLQAIAKVTIPEKEVKVKVSNPKAVDVKVNEVVGTQYQAPTLKPIEQTVNYKQGDVDLQDIPDEKTVRVDYEQGDMPDMPDDEQLTVTFKADDTDVKKKVDDIEKKDITAKKVKLEISTENAETFKNITKQLDAQGVDRNVQFTVTPKIDKSAFNEQNLNAKIADLKNKMSGITIGTQGWLDMQGLLADAQAFSNMLQTAIKNGMDVTSLNPQEFWKKIFGGTDIDTTELQSMLDQINAYLKEKGLEPMKLNFETGEMSNDKSSDVFKESMQKYDKLVGGLTQVASGLKNLGIELPEGVNKFLSGLQGISQIIQGVSSVLSVFGISALGSNTVALGLNTSGLAAVTAALYTNAGTNLIPFLSTGGMNKDGRIIHAAVGTVVPGNYGHDAVPAMLTSGEVVLNRAEVGNLVSQLNGGAFGDLHLEARFDMDGLRVALDNDSKWRSKGVYVTSKMR